MPAPSSLASLQTLLLVASVVTVVAAALLWRLTTRRRAAAPAVHVDELTLAAPTTETHPVTPSVAPSEIPMVTPEAVQPAPPLVAPLVAPEAGPLAPGLATAPPAEPGSHRRPSHRGTRAREVGYAELSRSYAALGRGDDAARAQWAADLRLVSPLMDALTAEDRIGLPAGLAGLEQASPRQSVDQARKEVVDLMAGTELGWPAAPMLSALDHLPELPGPGTGGATEPTSPEELQRRGEELMGRAGLVSPHDPEAARRDARAADLAALDAVLLESARRFGDTALISVELRRNLAAAALHDHEQSPDRLPLTAEVRRTRAVLRTVVEPHEASRLEEALAPEPSA